MITIQCSDEGEQVPAPFKKRELKCSELFG